MNHDNNIANSSIFFVKLLPIMQYSLGNKSSYSAFKSTLPVLSKSDTYFWRFLWLICLFNNKLNYLLFRLFS